jgi:hypothetical protein
MRDDSSENPLELVKVLSLGDTLLVLAYGMASVRYSIDVDGNSKPDFTFEFYGNVNGYGKSQILRLISTDSTYSPIESVMDANEEDTVYQNIVRIFDAKVTLHAADCKENNLKMSYYSDGNYPPTIYTSLDNWYTGSHYAGFKKK